ncbi:beta-galactosidase [Patescibacteria group bacterium]|nr:beta-galactosidase [Patescibacteria group bacterium]MBU4078146.1 beta-galactosidase [Patescibacteria group bacterium]
MDETKEIIQQWQYNGRVDSKLLEDKSFENCKKTGLTSVQSYVTWAEIEKEPGKFDFSTYDVLVEKLKKHNLKWVPFFILGPNYATPKWFQESDECVYAKCLEHNRESKIQSIWNPFLPKQVDRFLKMLSERYQDKSVLESICLGISGNWGESIYPVEGGFYKNFHSHKGWWCGDKYAVENFRKYITKKYNSLNELNAAWKTDISSFELINFPNLRYSLSFSREIYKFIPFFLRPSAKFIYNLLKSNSKKEIKDIAVEQKWLDFVDWYMASMTNWAEFWLKTARKYFPDNEIYLVTGGDGNPMLGADFSAQTKIAAKYNAGIRITNQIDDYSYSFAFARLISSASKFYGSYFTTEEVWINKPESVTMRIFDVITSGAKGFYCKNIIGTGKDYCTKKDFPAGEPTKGAEILSKNLNYFQLSKPIVKVGVFFPNTSIAFKPLVLDSLYKQCAKLRDVLDFDLLDENMIRDGVLEKYEYLLVLKGEILGGEVSEKIKNWIKKGGILSSNYKIIANDIDNEHDRVYVTRFADKIVYYNANNFEVTKKVGVSIIKIKANSIKIEQNKL